jgi:hypothetical protein
MKNNKIIPLTFLFFLSFSFVACDEKINNFVPDGHHKDGIHEIKVFPGFKGDLSQISAFKSQYTIYSVEDSMQARGIYYFKDSSTFNQIVRIFEPNFKINGFDFDNYYLAIVNVDLGDQGVFTCCASYQLKGYLNHHNKTIILKASAKYSKSGSYTSSDGIKFVSWVSIPRVAGEWKLIVENNL